MVQVTGLEPTRLMRRLAPEASALCPRNKFRYREIFDFTQFRHCGLTDTKKQAVFLRLVAGAGDGT